MPILQLYNGPMQTTAQPSVVTTGTAIKTMLQLAPIVPCWVKEFGISFDGSAAATPGTVELIETDVAATVTAFVAADITKLGPMVADQVAVSTYLTLGASASGYTSTGEGTPTAVRNVGGPWLLPPTGPFVIQFPLSDEGLIQNGKFLRVRVKFGAAVNCLCYLKVAV